MPTTASDAAAAPAAPPIARTVAEARRAIAEARARGARVGVVPTMGFLHEGHLRLVDEARRRADFVVMSIFVNPLQFGPSEDFSRYPRDAAGDAAKAASRGVDLLFTPSREEMYAEGRVVTVVPAGLDARWEGEVRPGHFAGVLTVVAKLFNILLPDVAVFGQKDFQQAALVRAMVRDLDFPVEIVVAPTVREPSGLALSSRNSYLSPEQHGRAVALSRSLRAVAATFDAGERSAAALRGVGLAVLEGEGGIVVDYLAVVDPERLEPVERTERGSVVLLAARVGATRLLDNLVLGG
ncbi:MAG: pantoate--beta-alanine ligase [Gemmatimonadaceae bacterium]